MKCKLCNEKAVVESGHFNIAAFMFPLCEEHMNEYQAFKNNVFK